MTSRRRKESPRREHESVRSLGTRVSSVTHYETIRTLGLLTPEAERADRIREVLGTLSEVNLRVPVIVEGKRDGAALRRLGLTGTIITLHGGGGMYEFCEDILARHDKVVLLTDWDARGDELFAVLAAHLRGIWEEYSPLRDILRALCQKDTKDVEGIPALFRRLAGVDYPMTDAAHEQ